MSGFRGRPGPLPLPQPPPLPGNEEVVVRMGLDGQPDPALFDLETKRPWPDADRRPGREFQAPEPGHGVGRLRVAQLRGREASMKACEKLGQENRVHGPHFVAAGPGRTDTVPRHCVDHSRDPGWICTGAMRRLCTGLPLPLGAGIGQPGCIGSTAASCASAGSHEGIGPRPCWRCSPRLTIRDRETRYSL